jgi:CheY-like chemotaxis protein
MSEWTHPPTALIVDDDKLAVEMLETYLQGQGFQTRAALSGQGALDIIEQELVHASRWRPWTIDLILLDIMMPGVDGYKVCLRVKDEPLLRHIPVIMVTALDSARGRNTALSFGADGYVTKPFLSEDLKSTIEAAMRIKKQQEALLRRTAELETLAATAQSVQQSLNLLLSLAGALTTLCQVEQIEAAAIYTLDEAGESLTLAHAQEGQKGSVPPALTSCAMGQGFIGRIAESQQGEWIGDMAARPDFSDRSEHSMRSCVGVALRVADRTVGLLEVFHPQPNWFDERDVRWLDELGLILGQAIVNTKLLERTQAMLAEK